MSGEDVVFLESDEEGSKNPDDGDEAVKEAGEKEAGSAAEGSEDNGVDEIVMEEVVDLKENDDDEEPVDDAEEIVVEYNHNDYADLIGNNPQASHSRRVENLRQDDFIFWKQALMSEYHLNSLEPEIRVVSNTRIY